MSTREVPAPDRTEGEEDLPRAVGAAAGGTKPAERGPLPGRRPALVPAPQSPTIAVGVAAAEAGQLAKPIPHGAPARHRTIVYDDQARRPNRKGPAQPTVEVRRVRRVLRRVDVWSLFRFFALLYGCALVVFLSAAVGLWAVASASGSIPSIEHFITQLFALKKFNFKPGQLLIGTVGVGLIWLFAATLFTVVAGILYNLISDVVGGIELTVLEEEPVE